jgi:dipeptidase D
VNEPGLVFKPQQVADWFGQIMRLQHGSGSEDALRAALHGWLKERLGIAEVRYVEAPADAGQRVICAYRPGADKWRRSDAVVLQAHLDMVVVTHPKDRDPFPLQPILHDGWLHAQGHGATAEAPIGSTLGADDGIGVATALTLLQDPELADCPIECLFTVQEETDMGGAALFPLEWIQGRRCLNLDDEEAGDITYGSAGGFESRFTGKLSREPLPEGFTTLRLSIAGLLGGHSGVDIARGRVNALAALVEGLCRMNQRLSGSGAADPGSFDLRLVDLERTDTIKPNAIPTSAAALIAVREADVADVIRSFTAWFTGLSVIHRAAEPAMSCRVTLAPAPFAPLSAGSTDNLLGFLRLVPHGVLRMIPGAEPPLVETSTNLYDVVLRVADLAVETSSRTSDGALLGGEHDEEGSPLNRLYANLAALYGLTFETGINWYPAWTPDPASPLLRTAREVFREVFGAATRTSVIHAGLECGWFATRYQGAMDCVAVGPTVHNPHTTDERLDTRSVEPFYRAVKMLIRALF